MSMTHEPWLVAVSVILTMLGSFTGLSLGVLAIEASGARRRILMSGAAISLALAAWMLAARASIAIDYLIPPILVSFIVCVVFMGAALLCLGVGPSTARNGSRRLEPDEPPDEPARDAAGARELTTEITVIKNGRLRVIATDDIVAVRADAHYTRIFDGVETYFCQLPIGDLGRRLDPRKFFRVHRSHIVNVGRIKSARLDCSRGLLELTARERYAVPVSRGRLGGLKARLSADGNANQHPYH